LAFGRRLWYGGCGMKSGFEKEIARLAALARRGRRLPVFGVELEALPSFAIWNIMF
jgi:hypothetical protein